MGSKVTTDIFIKRAKETHGDKYDYSLSEYVDSKTKVKIICNKHGVFTQKPSNHTLGNGCPKCGMERSNSHKLGSKDKFVKKSKEVHGDKYSYDKVKYERSNKKVEITCKKHGSFFQTPSNHKSGRGCPKCAIENKTKNQTKDTEWFINKAKEIHGDQYIYKPAKYIRYDEKLEVHCKRHGIFKITAASHLNGCGCQKCGEEKRESLKKYTNKDFIKKSKNIYKDKYDYTKTKYTGSKNKVTITCKEHGDFDVSPTKHLCSHRECPKCNPNTSEPEREINKFVSKYVNTKISDRDIIKPYEIDILIKKHNVGIEFNGLYYHSDKFVDKKYHLNKTNKMANKGYQLLHIFSDEWKYKNDIVKSVILSKIGKIKNRYYARKTFVREVPTKDAMKFLENNHLQGKVGGSVKLGLYKGEELLSIMTFGKLRKNLGNKHKEGSYEMLRFCNKLNSSVVGGASKLFKTFLRLYDPLCVLTYADLRYSNGNIYKKIGFKEAGKTRPNYFYSKRFDKRENRFKYRKSKLVKMGYDKSKSEIEIMHEIGYNRIYDCGNLKFEYNKIKK